MSQFAAGALCRRMGFPRVSGDEPERAVALAATLGFSPRERG